MLCCSVLIFGVRCSVCSLDPVLSALDTELGAIRAYLKANNLPTVAQKKEAEIKQKLAEVCGRSVTFVPLRLS